MLANLRQLFRYRGLIRTLVARELKARYRGSVLGYFWSFINPLLLLLVYSFVFSYVMPRGEALATEPYAVFLFCGLLPWTWFSSSLSDGANVLIMNGNLIKKVMFPAEILPVVSVLSNMVHFLFGLPILFGFLWLYGISLRPIELVWFPLVLAVQEAVARVDYFLPLVVSCRHIDSVVDRDVVTARFNDEAIDFSRLLEEDLDPDIVLVHRLEVEE